MQFLKMVVPQPASMIAVGIALTCCHIGCGGGEGGKEESSVATAATASTPKSTSPTEKSTTPDQAERDEPQVVAKSPKTPGTKQTSGKSAKLAAGKTKRTTPPAKSTGRKRTVKKPAGKKSVAKQPTPKPQPTDTVRFDVLPVSGTVTSMALSEDGRLLAISHQEANRISIWDVAANALSKTISTTTPRSMLFRGRQLIVANDGAGTISVFKERNGEWKLGKEVKMPYLRVVHISAPQGKQFKTDVIVTCHGSGRSASYRDANIFRVGLKSRTKPRLVCRKPMANVGFAGRFVVAQASFNLSPSGSIYGYRWRDFVSGRTQTPVFRGGIQQTPYVYQAHPGTKWLADNMVFDGFPLKAIRQNIGSIIIPDMSQRVFYALTKTEIVAHRLDDKLTEIARRPAGFGRDQTKDFGRVSNLVYRRRRYMLDHPLAFTQGKIVRLFVIDQKSNQILTATAPAFATPGAEEFLVGAEPKLDDPAKPKPGFKIPTRPNTGTPTRVRSPQRGAYGIPVSVFAKQFLAHTLVAQGATFELLKGPKGLSITNGRLSWRPEISAVGTHSLRIKVKQGRKTTIITPKIEVLFRQNGGKLSEIAGVNKLPMTIDHHHLTYGLGHTSLLLLQGDTLKRLAADGVKVTRTMKLKHRYRFIAERKDAFIALSSDPKRLDVIDKKTLRVRKQILLNPLGVRVTELKDIALHPTRRVSYVSIKHDIRPPRYRVLIIDETTGKVAAPEDVIGTWIAVDPAGRYLYAAYKDIYTRGSRFHINPGGRVIQIPKYGSIDWLISYSLRGATPTALQIVRDAGGNGQGLRLSADGKRITYLSHVGYPSFSGNLAGFDSSNFKEGVTYNAKDAKASPKNLAYHPTLNLVAVAGTTPAEIPAVIFDRESAKPLPGKLPIPKGGLGRARIDRLMFSPDGKSLVFQCSGTDGLCLFSLPLKLTSLEQRKIKKGVVVPKPAFVPGKNTMTVRRTDLDALRIRKTKKTATVKQIARDFMPSVVLIRSGQSTATGFVVGRKGYVLTCAHSISASGKAQVVVQSTSRGVKRKETYAATIVRLDDQRDLALLKIVPGRLLTSVTLASAAKVDAGESVTVIGNPGLGAKVLSQTLTTGVVSSAERQIGGLPYIQTSAAVNPGNSGGPMFDGRGQVIGLIVLKANTDSTAFAVPSKDLREFLLATTKRESR